MNQKRHYLATTCLFLAVQAVLYHFILNPGDTTVWVSMYSAIVLCFLYALANVKTASLLMLGGLACTLGADYCLVVCVPIQQLYGMIFFLGAQTFYAIKLHRESRNKALLIVRLALTVVAEVITVVVLKEKTDPLALVSLAYYANLIMNLVEACMLLPKEKLLSVGLLCFILCDTVIGLQVASGGYLTIPEGSFLHRILWGGFNLSWFFYLPSQVLLALRCARERKSK